MRSTDSRRRRAIPSRHKKWASAAGMAACTLMAGQALAQQPYPQRPIQLIVGYAPGGSADSCSRAIAKGAEDILRQPVVIQNKPGAASSLSIAWLRHQKPDGYTIATLSTGALLNQFMDEGVGYDVRKDIQPIAMVAQYQVGMVVRADSPFHGINDVIEAARKDPQAISYATAGQGTPQHFTMERLAKVAGVHWTHVPYKNGPEGVVALIRGDVSVMAQSAEWLPYVRDGRLRLISFFQDKRMAGYENVPTLQESGYDMVAPSILGLAAPKGTPADIVKKLQDAFGQASQTPEFANCADTFGLRVDFRPTDAFTKHIRDTADFWEPIGKEISKANR